MRKNLRKFFLLGLGAAAAGFAVKHRKQVREAVKDLVKKNKLSKRDADKLKKDIFSELERAEKKLKKTVKKARPRLKKALKKAKKLS